jgi:hypothetical protein
MGVIGFALAGCGVHGASSALPGNASFGRAEPRAALDSKTIGGQDLLYAVEDERKVLIFSYPQMKRLKQIRRSPGYHQVAECADENGNVYIITDFILTSGNEFIDEYAHGGTKPIRSFFDYGLDDTGCAVDRATGNLAVTGGYVEIWSPSESHGQAQRLKIPAGFGGFACTYDYRGNLFVIGTQVRNSRRHMSLVEFPRGSGTYVRIALPRTHVMLRGTGTIRWDGKYLALGRFKDKIYRLAVSGNKARVAETIRLGKATRVISFWIQGKTIVGGGYIWNYPAGGKPIVTIGAAAMGAVAVSVPPRH